MAAGGGGGRLLLLDETPYDHVSGVTHKLRAQLSPLFLAAPPLGARAATEKKKTHKTLLAGQK
jgi:hypothetical protein